MAFQSTPPRGGRRVLLDRSRILSRFNPRPRVGGDIFIKRGREFMRFQSTPPRGGRLGCAGRDRGSEPFQSTPPRGGRRWQAK